MYLLLQLPTNCDEDESSVARLPGGWVAVLNYTGELGASPGTVGECPGIMDRVSDKIMVLYCTSDEQNLREKY